jgi:hypothetical protein
MAKQIIVLSTNQNTTGLVGVVCLFWLTVPAGSELLKPSAGSAWVGASAGEISALQNGTVIEEFFQPQFPATLTKAQIEAQLLAVYTARQAAFTAGTKPGQYFGVFCDAGVWSS